MNFTNLPNIPPPKPTNYVIEEHGRTWETKAPFHALAKLATALGRSGSARVRLENATNEGKLISNVANRVDEEIRRKGIRKRCELKHLGEGDV
jgi:hypothetical protein